MKSKRQTIKEEKKEMLIKVKKLLRTIVSKIDSVVNAENDGRFSSENQISWDLLDDLEIIRDKINKEIEDQ